MSEPQCGSKRFTGRIGEEFACCSLRRGHDGDHKQEYLGCGTWNSAALCWFTGDLKSAEALVMRLAHALAKEQRTNRRLSDDVDELQRELNRG